MSSKFLQSRRNVSIYYLYLFGGNSWLVASSNCLSSSHTFFIAGKVILQGLTKTTTWNWDLGRLVGGLVAIFCISPSQLGISSSQLTNSSFSEGWPSPTTNQVGIQSLGGTIGTIGTRFGSSKPLFGRCLHRVICTNDPIYISTTFLKGGFHVK